MYSKDNEGERKRKKLEINMITGEIDHKDDSKKNIDNLRIYCVYLTKTVDICWK